jgi:hypothetical protein
MEPVTLSLGSLEFETVKYGNVSLVTCCLQSTGEMVSCIYIYIYIYIFIISGNIENSSKVMKLTTHLHLLQM